VAAGTPQGTQYPKLGAVEMSYHAAKFRIRDGFFLGIHTPVVIFISPWIFCDALINWLDFLEAMHFAIKLGWNHEVHRS